MSFDNEWAQLKARADTRRGTHTQLNQLAPDPGGSTPQGDLKVSQTELAAIGDAAFRLHQDLDRDGDHARVSSFKAASSLEKDFAVGRALDFVATRWVDQQRSLLDACAHISNHLDYTKHAHKGEEEYLATIFSKISTLEHGFDKGADR
ncbi:hypothetical protein [Streptomyces albidus (ex Kaewkla and Franco 2022)]|uniref:hypothetical protein n=1 Tax=Streptomyces albidus (ex Kaewkla and Franco 2022) TaxID=722709 RepID=UPI0015EF9637|nr:hypothetical protein [Streptomyces albidus (ex Kaewkla and Franco 2022)]